MKAHVGGEAEHDNTHSSTSNGRVCMAKSCASARHNLADIQCCGCAATVAAATTAEAKALGAREMCNRIEAGCQRLPGGRLLRRLQEHGTVRNHLLWRIRCGVVQRILHCLLCT